MDYQQATQDQHPLPSEADGCTFTDYRPLQALTGKQTGVRQDALELVRFARKESFVIASTGHLLHLCDDAFETRQ